MLNWLTQEQGGGAHRLQIWMTVSSTFLNKLIHVMLGVMGLFFNLVDYCRHHGLQATWGLGGEVLRGGGVACRESMPNLVRS